MGIVIIAAISEVHKVFITINPEANNVTPSYFPPNNISKKPNFEEPIIPLNIT